MPVPVFVAALLKSGFSLLANAALVKGKEWVEKKAGVTLSDTPTQEDISKLAQFQENNLDMLLKLRQEDNRLEEAYLADKQDARKRDTMFITAGRKNERGDNLAYLAVGGLLATLFLVFFAEVSQGQKEILLFVLGVLSGIVKDVYGFEFGTSKDAAKMQNTMTTWLDEEK